MTPVNLGNLPSGQAIPTGLGQLHRGAWDGEGGVPADGGLFVDPYNPMTISVTTGAQPCWWVVRAEMIFRVLEAAWYYFAWGIRCSPADALGIGDESSHGRLHSAISWQHYACDTAFRLAANTTYTAGMYFGYRQAGCTIYGYYGPGYMYLGGELIADGSL